MKLKGTHHVALRTPNFEAMEQFYSQTLSFPIVRRWDDKRIIFIDIGSTTIELIGREQATADTQPTGGWDHVALLVDNVDEAYAELVEKGVRIRSAPVDAGEVRIAFFFDPDGNVLELFEEKR